MGKHVPSNGPESPEHLRAIIHSATDAILVTDEDHRITLFNAAAETMFRCAASEVLGTVLDRFVPDRFRDLYRAFMRDAPGAEAIASDERPADNVLTMCRADGDEFPVEARVSQAAVDGRQLFTVIIRDVTERLRAHAAQSQLAAIVESSDDAIIGKNLDAIVTSWNAGAERLLGYSASEMVGQSILRIVPPERRAEVAKILASIRRGERVDHYETERIRKDGRRINVSLTVSPIRGADGTIVGASKIARDVTARVQAAEERERLLADARAAWAEAEAATRAKDELLSTVSHELRTPLAAMLGWAGLLHDKKITGARAERALEVILRSGQSQAKLIDDLLDLSRIVTGRFRIDVRRVSLADVVGAAIDALRGTADQKAVRIVVRGRRDPAWVMADAERLQQVVWNLVNNAVKFTPAGGRVDVELGTDGADGVLVVRDTGAGIPPAFMPRLFEPFQQVDSVRSRESKGLGLGLSIVRRIVELHRGTVAAASDGPGKGSTFTVRVPLATGDATAVASPAASPPREIRLDGVHVLVVEDDPAMRDLVCELLEQHGARVTPAASVAEAHAALGRWSLDVVVSDIRLPDATAYDLVRRLRAEERTRAIPAVAVTGYAAEEDEARALAAGFQVHLEKPLDPQRLVAAVATFGRTARN